MARLVGVLLVVLVVLAACGSDRDDSVAVYRQPGESVAVTTGNKFMIELEANPTTGYTWQLSAPAGEQLSLIDQDYTPVGPQRPGSGGVQQFTFQAASAGSTTLTFDYVRPWEKDVAPAQTATYSVKVS